PGVDRDPALRQTKLAKEEDQDRDDAEIEEAEEGLHRDDVREKTPGRRDDTADDREEELGDLGIDRHEIGMVHALEDDAVRVALISDACVGAKKIALRLELVARLGSPPFAIARCAILDRARVPHGSLAGGARR